MSAFTMLYTGTGMTGLFYKTTICHQVFSVTEASSLDLVRGSGERSNNNYS